MESLSESEVEEIFSDKITDRNHWAYRNNPFQKSIDHERIYLYYVDLIESNKEPNPWVYLFDPPRPLRNRDEIREAIEYLAQNAAVQGNRPHHIGQGFEFIKWTMRSLIVIVIDFTNSEDGERWKFKHNGGILFLDDGEHTPNHTFYDAFDYNLNVTGVNGNSREVSALCFENHMAGEDKRPLGAGEERFKYNLYPGARGRFYPQPIDPGGTNLGPPPDEP
jgi:hypothetical protein